jgi:hypothetical protein
MDDAATRAARGVRALSAMGNGSRATAKAICVAVEQGQSAQTARAGVSDHQQYQCGRPGHEIGTPNTPFGA